jgi:NAD(P)-dependent dehydrogenase (short-subunit alcohol dehydrogenase family)
MSRQHTNRPFGSLPFARPTHCRRYEGRVAIVTATAQGLGRVIAKRLAEEGAKLVVCDIQQNRLAVAARELREETGMVGGDLSEAGVADHVVERALAAYRQIDTLVNNTAALIRPRLTDFTEELMQKAVRWSVWNTLRCCKAVLPHRLERRYGRIVNIGGEAWRTGAPYHAAGRNRRRLDGRPDDHPCRRSRRHGITVNCVSPGAIETEADGAHDPTPPGFREPGWTDPAFFEEMSRMAAGRVVGIGRPAHPTVDDRTRGIFRVNRRVFTDPEILELERYAGHESEIAKPGDFATRRVGGPADPDARRRRDVARVPQHLPESRQHRVPRARWLDPPLSVLLSRLGV